MNPSITKEMANALAEQEEVRVTDPTTQRVYVLVDDDIHRRAMDALRQQEDIAAIQQGIDDMQAGKMQSAEEAQQHGRDELLSRFGQ